MFKRMLWGAGCLAAVLEVVSGMQWDSIEAPRLFRNSVVEDKYMDDADLKAIENIKYVEDSRMPLFDKVAILWSAKRALDSCMPKISAKCMDTIANLLVDGGNDELASTKDAVSNYHIGHWLLRSQASGDNAATPLKDCSKLKAGYDDGLVSDAIVLLQNERNGSTTHAEEDLAKWGPILKTEGFDL